MMLNFLYGSSKRIFLNTSIGCNSKCKYCYLPKLGVKEKQMQISAENLLNVLQNTEYLNRGRKGSIISLGCYSECLDTDNLDETNKLLAGLLPMGNPIQLATKQKLTERLSMNIVRCRKYIQQVTIFISMPTISDINKIEIGTASYEERVLNMELCERYNIPKVLYIKPFLKDVTTKDVSKYIDLIHKFKLPVVVGNFLYDTFIESPADVGEGLLYDGGLCDEKEDFMTELRKHTVVFEHSTEFMMFQD